MRGSVLLVGLAVALVACGAPEREEASPLRTSRQAIVNGSLSPASQDATVLISDRGDPICSGTLIAPNLVLTARHCVSQYDESSECGTVLRDVTATRLTISVGPNADERNVAARGANLYVPATSSLCSADLALLSLDKDVPDITPRIVSFAAPSLAAMGTAVGYGGSDARTTRSDVKILAVGPVDYSYRTRGGELIPMDPLVNEIVTTESTCFGDSGGPLLDDRGRVFAVASRGIDRVCTDRPTFWTTLAGNEKLVRDAASAVGHPIADVPAGSSSAPGKTPVTAGGPTAGAGEDEGAGPAGGSGTKAAPDGSGLEAESRGCSAAPRRIESPLGAVAGFALALAALRRRSSRPSSLPSPP